MTFAVACVDMQLFHAFGSTPAERASVSNISSGDLSAAHLDCVSNREL
jgi:hypothetical protein